MCVRRDSSKNGFDLQVLQSFPGYGMRISPIWGIALGKLFLTLMLKMLSAQKLESISKRRFNTSEMGNGNSYP